MPPHLHLPSAATPTGVARSPAPGAPGCRCVSVNPGLRRHQPRRAQPRDPRAVAAAQSSMGSSSAHDCRRRAHVVVAGRLHALAPARPATRPRGAEDALLSGCCDRAEPLGVGIALENSPYGFLGRAEDVLAVVEAVDRPRLGCATTWPTRSARRTRSTACGTSASGSGWCTSATLGTTAGRTRASAAARSTSPPSPPRSSTSGYVGPMRLRAGRRRGPGAAAGRRPAALAAADGRRRARGRSRERRAGRPGWTSSSPARAPPGSTAALAAAAAGASVLLVEAGGGFGGTTALSGGRVWAPNNRYGIEAGRPDSPWMPAPTCARPARRRRARSWTPSWPPRPGSSTGSSAEPASVRAVPALSRLPPGAAGRDPGRAHARLLAVRRRRASWRAGAARAGLGAGHARRVGTLALRASLRQELLAARERDGVVTGGRALVAGLLAGCLRGRCDCADIHPPPATAPGRGCDRRRRRRARRRAHRCRLRAAVLATGGFEWDAGAVAPRPRARRRDSALRPPTAVTRSSWPPTRARRSGHGVTPG